MLSVYYDTAGRLDCIQVERATLEQFRAIRRPLQIPEQDAV